jgi:TPR repeat protein
MTSDMYDKSMIRFLSAVAFSGALILAGSLSAGPMEDASAAFDAGDYARALPIWRSQAQSGSAEAQNQIGLLYLAGKGVAADPVEAVRWFRLAAMKGLPTAQFNLAECYATGNGVPLDAAAANDLYAKAAKRGLAAAQYKMGILLSKDAQLQSVLLDAAEWFKKAADQGNIPAQVNLAVAFADGQGVRRDQVEALKWLDIVAHRLPPSDTVRKAMVDKIRAALAARMTQEQITRAQSFADNWQPARP